MWDRQNTSNYMKIQIIRVQINRDALYVSETDYM